MRIIAGKLKGQAVKTVKDANTRPTSDKLKEAIFHKLGPFFEGGNCLDLFAGSGALGVEAISRGMDHVVFIDKSIAATKVIQRNITALKIEKQCEVYRNDAFRALQILSKKDVKFDLILIDPPYERINYSKLLQILEKTSIYKVGTIIYIEHRPEEILTYNHLIYHLKEERKINNTTSITILEII